MPETTKLGLYSLAASLLLGLAGEMLVTHSDAPGLGFSLWISLCVGGLLAVARTARVPLTGEGRWLLIPAVLLAAAFSWRDSPALLALDFVALALTLAWVTNFGRDGSLRRASLSGYVLSALRAAGHAFAGFVPALFLDIEWGKLPRGRWSHQAASIVRGLLIAVPLLMIFGGLFIAADAVFADLVANTFELKLDTLFERMAAIGFTAWLAAAFLRATLVAKPTAEDPLAGPPKLALGAVETGMVLGLLNALFLAFVLVQFRYFFGGAEQVAASTTLTYAEYARRGFFELVWVSALVLPLLLLGHWLIPAENPGQLRLYGWMAGALIAQLFVIMASALQRMLLYQQEFGLTELRLFASAFMGWLALLFAWFLVTVLRGQRERFAFGVLVTGLAVLGALHLLNPDALIARVNVDRQAAGHRFDPHYAATLSADAVPVLVEALPRLSPEDRAVLTAGLVERWAAQSQPNWQSWNWARARALKNVQLHLPKQ